MSTAQPTAETRHDLVRHRWADVAGQSVFYREAGDPSAPTIVLLHGFPSASHQFSRLIDRLAGRYHLIAPDYPGFGHSSSPVPSTLGGDFDYTFDALAGVVEEFLAQLRLGPFFLYVFDFGAPVGFRIATRHPEWIAGVVAQNGNAYEAGFGAPMQLQARYWADREGMTDDIRKILTLDVTRAQHLDGTRDATLVDPDTWVLDQHWLDTPGREQVMLDLLFDYRTNTALYPQWQRWLREHRPPLLLPWGRNDDFFTADGARAYLRDVPDAELHLLDGGHFVLDEHLVHIAGLIADFVDRHTG